MKRKLLVTVCICVSILLSILTAYASQDYTTEYVFDIVRASCVNNPGGGYDITLNLYQRKPCTGAKIVLWVYGESSNLMVVELFDAYSFDEPVTVHTDMDLKNAYVSVWESGASVKPIAKKVSMGHVTFSSYTIEYYKQNIERNGYNLYSTKEVKDVETGTVVTLAEASLPSYDGFSFDSSNTSNVLSGKVTPEGFTFKVYYNHIVDENELVQVKYRLEKLLTTFNRIQGNLTQTEKPLVKICKETVEAVLDDSDVGALIYIEDYVSVKYKTKVDDARKELDELIAQGGYNDFKSKLTRYLSMADVEYLAKIMFGIDDIYQYEKEHL